MLYHELQARGLKTEILDGDVVRQNLSKGLGFSKEDRDTNILRIGFVADLLTRNGVATICCPISPYKAARDAVRAQIGTFVEVYVHATVEEIAANRDPKGLYKKALAGEITGFTGVDDPYEAPEDPELVVDTLVETPEESLQKVMDTLARLGHIDDPGLLVEGERLHSGFTDLRVTGIRPRRRGELSHRRPVESSSRRWTSPPPRIPSPNHRPTRNTCSPSWVRTTPRRCRRARRSSGARWSPTRGIAGTSDRRPRSGRWSSASATPSTPRSCPPPAIDGSSPMTSRR